MRILFGGGLLLGIVSAFLCYFIASRNGMNKIGWPILGLLLPVIGLLVTFLVAFSKTDDKV